MKVNSAKERRYTNAKQWAFLGAQQREKVFVGGIGSGKSTVESMDAAACVRAMPRSKGFLLSSNFLQIHNKILPAFVSGWEKVNLFEDIHYVIGRRPPKFWKMKPIEPPTDYRHVISFFNGACMEMLSAEQKDNIRGGSYQWGMVDEAGLIPEKTFNGIVMGRLRGDKNLWKGPKFMSLSIVTSMPFLPSGMWPLQYEQYAQEDPKNYFYIESTTEDNLAILGPQYIRNLKKKLTISEYNREVLNMRSTRLPNCFYSSLDDEHHTYEGFAYEYGDSYRDFKAKDADTDPKRPLDVSFDTGGTFNCCTVWQDFTDLVKPNLKAINCFDVENPLIIDDLVDKLHEYYKGHPTKYIRIWGDKSANAKTGNTRYTFYEQIANRLRGNGWHVELKYDGWQNPDHAIKHLVINSVLKEEDPSVPVIRINRTRCKALLISMFNAGIKDGYKKDKSTERTLTVRAEATDYSDSFDYFVFPRLSYTVTEGSSVPMEAHIG